MGSPLLAELCHPGVPQLVGIYAGPGSGAGRRWAPDGCEAGRTGSLWARCQSRWGRQGCRAGRPGLRISPPSSPRRGWGAAALRWSLAGKTSHNPGGRGRSRGYTLDEPWERQKRAHLMIPVKQRSHKHPLFQNVSQCSLEELFCTVWGCSKHVCHHHCSFFSHYLLLQPGKVRN